MTWEYEDDPNRKHKQRWKANRAGFLQVGNEVVAKCPRNLDHNTCVDLLNRGIEFSPKRWRFPYPDRIYNIHDGVVYRATKTRPGTSYHGFPELPDRVAVLPRDVREKILDLAESKGCREAVEKWLKN